MIASDAGSIITSSFFLAHRNQDFVGAGIVNCIARIAAQRDCLHERAGDGVDHSIRVPVFIGDENPLHAGCIGQSVRIMDWPSLANDLQRLRIDGEDLVVPVAEAYTPFSSGTTMTP